VAALTAREQEARPSADGGVRVVFTSSLVTHGSIAGFVLRASKPTGAGVLGC